METKKTKGSVGIAVLILITPLCTILPYIAASVLMDDIMESLNVGYSQAGLTMTIMFALCGVCMFLGSAVQDKMGIKNTICFALGFLALGCVICFISTSYFSLLLGRILSGIGFGLCSVSVSPYMSTWFKGKQRTVMVTANLIANSLVGILAYILAPSLRDATGSWQGVFGIYTLIILAILLLWFFSGKSNAELDAAKRKNVNTEKRGMEKNSLYRAFRIKQYRILMLMNIFSTCAITSLTTFMPTFITNGKGLSLAFAVAASSAYSLATMCGSIAGGVAIEKTGRRKTILCGGLLIMMLGGLAFSLANTQTNTLVTVCAIGLGYMFFLPAQSVLVMETPKPFDPVILGGASALVNGVGQILSIAVSSLFSLLSLHLSMAGAYLVFFSLLMISIVLSFTLRETGLEKTIDQNRKEVTS